MTLVIDFADLRRSHFVVWRPAFTVPAPCLYIASESAANALGALRQIALKQHDTFPELWSIPASDCDLVDGTVYWYWFAVRDSDPYLPTDASRLCTDAFATTVDRRYPAPDIDGLAGGQPASVIMFVDNELTACDPDGSRYEWKVDDYRSRIAPNNRLVLYELPTRWTRSRTLGTASIGVGTFFDILALFDAQAEPFRSMEALRGASYFEALGINGLELLPPADSARMLDWGYGTANFFAADYNLGRTDPEVAPTASTGLASVIDHCHAVGMRFFLDMVMAFARECPLRNLNFLDFFVQFASGDAEQGNREGFGGDLFKFDYWTEGFDPRSGKSGGYVPARAYLQLYLRHWMTQYRVDGLRLDSVNNIANDDFLQEVTNLGHDLWRDAGGTDDCFLVVGEELSVPMHLVEEARLDGLWNEHFKQIARCVILGESWDGASSFEDSVRTLIDCRLLGYSDGAQAVNYLTSHDTGGPGNERLYDWLHNNGVIDAEPRMKLAFTCLLTAVGIPMILAGDEFAEQQDLDLASPDRGDSNKQIDPINYLRLHDDWRQRVFAHVACLTRLRTTHSALAENDLAFIHVDVEDDRRILAWQRGSGGNLVVVVANFSDFSLADDLYDVPNWPEAQPDSRWHDVTEDRSVPEDHIASVAVRPWSSHVFAVVQGTEE